MSGIVLSLDIGTSKLAAVAVDVATNGNLAVESAPNDSTITSLAPGRHEQCPLRIREIGLELLRRLAARVDISHVEGIAFSGQMHGVLLVDSSLELRSNLITWCDQRAEAVVRAADRSTYPVARTGCFLHAGYGGATLAFLRPETGTTALTIADYLAASLCGVVATEPTHAASWGIFDVRNNVFDGELVRRLGIAPSVLPVVRPSAGVLGLLLPERAWQLGLPETVRVHSPVGDNQAGYLGICGRNADSVLLNLGTGGQISLPMKEFHWNPELETRPLPGGGFIQVGSSLCGGRAYAVLKEFFADVLYAFTGEMPSDGELYKTMDRIAAASSEALRVDTRFAGSRMEPERRGEIGNIGIENFRAGALARGVTEGMVRELSSMLPAEIRPGLRRVCAGGNAVRKSPLARAAIEREFALPCILAERNEEAAAGAALAAIWFGGAR